MKRSNLSPSQTAELLHVAPSTLRLWSQLFADYLSPEAHSDGRKHRSYSPDDISLLQRAGDLLKTHGPDEVKTLLSLGDDVQRSAALATLPTIAGEINVLRSAVVQLRSEAVADRAEIERLRSEVQRLGERHNRQRSRQGQEIADLQTQIRTLTLAVTAKRSWWARLRG